MKIDVFQCQLNKKIPLEYIGKVVYIGPDDFLRFTNNKEYYIVLDENNTLKVVDDEEEDYIYNLSRPNDIGGKFYFTDDPQGILKNYMEEYKN